MGSNGFYWVLLGFTGSLKNCCQFEWVWNRHQVTRWKWRLTWKLQITGEVVLGQFDVQDRHGVGQRVAAAVA